MAVGGTGWSEVPLEDGAPLVELCENPVSLFYGEPRDQEEKCFALNDQTPLFPDGEERKGVQAHDAGFESWFCHLSSLSLSLVFGK